MLLCSNSLRSPRLLLRVASFLSALLLGTVSHAQVATLYSFGQSSGTYTEITGGTSLWAVTTAFGIDFGTFDDAVSSAQTIPAFNFNGTSYTQMYVSTNGFITFGAAPSAGEDAPLSGTGSYARCVSAFGADLNNAATGTGTRDIRWQQVGNEVVVQWRRVRRVNVSEVFSFQIRLNTATGAIRTIYGPVQSGPSNSTSFFPEVGLRGPKNTFATNVNNRLVSNLSDGINWGNSQAGTSNNSKLRFSSANPAKSWTSGLTYTWTPLCNQPSATASTTANCATNTYTVAVNVTALNGAPSVTIQSPTGTNVLTNVGVGTHLITGIPMGTARTVTVVHNGNTACNLSLGSFNHTDPDQVCHAASVYPIPDNGCGSNTYVDVPFCISAPGTALGTTAFVRSVDVVVSHTFNADLELSLIGPSGTQVSLIADRFAGGDNLGNPGTCPNGLLTFQAGGAALTTTATSNVTGTYAPEQPLSNFHNGSDPTGTWTLRACDDAAVDAGAVRYVRLNLCLPPTATFTAQDDCANGQFSVQVNVSSLGTGSSATLNYTVNGTPFTQTGLGLGNTVVGPFAAGSEVICTLVNNIASCGSVQGTVYSNCPVTIPCGTTIPVTHCYRNNDSRTFAYTSSNPFETVTLSFVSGTMDPNDVLRAYSGTDNSGAPIPSLTGSFANLAGVSGTSTGNSIYVEIDSDGSNSCATGQQSTWNFEVECTAGCVDPDGAVTVNTNCAAYNFSMDVEVFFTGDAASTTLRYSVNGGAPTDIPGLVDFDVQNIGPFAIDDVVNVRLLHESDATCDRNLGNFTDNNTCPSAENCINALNLASQTSPLPGTTVGRTNDFSFACGTATTNTAPDAIYYLDVPAGYQLHIRQQTNNYNSQHYVRYGGSCPGSTVIACVDDDNAEIGWVDWINNTGSTQRAWWIQDGKGTASGTFTLEWQLISCPAPTSPSASGITNTQATANFICPAGNYIVEWGPASTFTTPGTGATAGPNGTVINTTSDHVHLTGLSANTQYRFFVRRNCAVGSYSANTSATTFTTLNTPPTVIANNTCGANLAITDNGCGTNAYLLASIAISGQPNSLGSNVGLSSVEFILTHSYRADLIISLISPTGQEVSLVNQRGGSDNNFGNNASCPGSVFRLIAGGAALSSIPASNNVTGNYAPEQALTGFNSGNPNGNWTLKICDNANLDNGALRFVKLNFQPIDCLGQLGGTAMPGTACNDGNACTINDVWSAGCTCAGTVQDTDSDGTCDANDGCPNDPDKIAPGVCGCGVADTDSDNDGTANCNDGCPNDPNKIAAGACGCGMADTDSDSDGTADCNDGCPNDPNKIAPGVCGCGVMDTDSDNDGLADCVDACPFLPGLQNGDICDANPGTGYTLGTVVNCSCQMATCNNGLSLELQTDGVSEVTWELRQQGTNTLVQSGGGIYPPSPGYGENTCLPDGCFYLRVLDDGGDGIAGGGYILRHQGKRLIDNRNNFTNGSVSAIANNEGFCLPMGTDHLIYLSCDRLDWTNTEYIIANDNPAVSAQWLVGDQTDDGYEMWFFNPNGGYSFRRFHSHATSDGYGPASATRACHIKVNNWSAANQVQAGVLLNVKVRSRVNGVNSGWGPACRFKYDPVRAQCQLTKLMDIPGNQFYSCGSMRNWGTGNYVHARPINGANKYQFRFRIPAENFSVTRTSNTYFVQLGWAIDPLVPCKTYEVDVRVSKDGGATWCTDFIAPALTDAWGDICLLTINCAAQGGGQNMSLEGDTGADPSTLRVYPNPNRGDQLFLSLNGLKDEARTIQLDIHDTYGKRVITRSMAPAGGSLNTSLDLRNELAAGMYVITITAGEQVFSERLLIQP